MNEEVIKQLTKNSIQCLQCNVILESTHRHHMVMCDCENKAFTDGGLVYQRVGAMDLNKVRNLSEYLETITPEELEKVLKDHRESLL